MSDTATGPWREALGVIDSLLTLSPQEREDKLGELAGTRPDLHQRVRALMDADAEATRTGFLSVRREAGEAGSVARLAPDAKLGPYRIVRELGTGGMGEVWLARRDDGLYEGEVAIKTLHPFFAHGVLRERFLREAQLLGKLTHPNIARLLDAGVADGIVYLVLEYVRGTHIDAYCDQHSLEIAERLAIFDKVCAAVASAHASLVVHRDIKPGNILVTESGDVKLLDFGIGKILEADASAESAELTRVTGRVFTPEFAAPEQILGDSVTTATDVYSLGALLYTLLSGQRPFGELTSPKVEQAVLHEEPRALSAAAPPERRRALSGDLEHITHLALRKAPAQRYGSAQALRDDLARYRRHEPVLARAGSRAYRLNRFVRRHRVGVAASLGMLIAAIVGVAGVLYQAREARAQATLARREAEKATSTKDYLLKIFEANSTLHPNGVEARKTTAEELMDVATAEILKGGTQDPEVRYDLMLVLTNINGQMEKFDAQEALGIERIRIAEQTFGVTDIRLADALNDHGDFLRSRSRKEEALAVVNRAVQLREAQGDSSSWTRGVSSLELGQISVSNWAGEDDVPIRHFHQAIDILGKLPPSHELVRSNLGLARAYEFKAEYDKAIEWNRKGIALAEKVDGPMTISVAGGNQQWARTLGFLYRFEEAEQHVAKAVEIFTFIQGPDGGFTTGARLDVARLKARRGLHKEAIADLEPLLVKRLTLDAPNSGFLRNIRGAMGASLVAVGDFPRAREQLDAFSEALSKQGSVVLKAVDARLQAGFANEDGRPADALRHADAGLAHLAQAPESKERAQYLLRYERATALVALGRVADARATLQDAVPLLEKLEDDPDKFDTLLMQVAEARADIADKQPKAARDRMSAALAKVQASSRRREVWSLEDALLRGQAEAQLALGNAREACAALDASIALRGANALPIDPRIAAAKKLKSRCGT